VVATTTFAIEPGSCLPPTHDPTLPDRRGSFLLDRPAFSLPDDLSRVTLTNGTGFVKPDAVPDRDGSGGWGMRGGGNDTADLRGRHG
jgi:hypothetical protein